MLFVILIATLVLVTGIIATLLPVALPILLPIVKLSRVNVTVAPHVLPESLCLSVQVLANVGVSDSEVIASLSMPQALFPFAFVLVSVTPNVLSEAVRFV